MNASLELADEPTTVEIRPRLVHIVTVSYSLILLRGQIAHMKSRGFDVQVVSSPGELLDQTHQREQIAVHELPMSRRISLVSDFVSLVRLWKILRKVRPDVVHSHTPKAGLLGTIAARLAGVPVVALSVFGLPQMTRTGFMRRLLDFTTRLSCRLAHWVWCDSPSMREYMIKAGLCSADKLVCLGHGSVNGIDSSQMFSPVSYTAEQRQQIRSRYDIPNDALVVGFVGRIVGDKGMHELASAWRSLRARHPNLHLLIVGPFEANDRPSEDVERMFRNDNRIHLAGMQNDVAAHLSVIDIFVNPSYREGFGIANIEAAAMQIPVVSTRIPGCVDSVQDGVTGTLVPPRNAQALEAALEAYLDDAVLRYRHGRAGRDRVVRCFQPQANWKALEAAYRELLDRHQGEVPNPAQVFSTNQNPSI